VKKFSCFGGIIFSVLLFSTLGVEAAGGPLHITDSHPLFLGVGSPSLVQAKPDDSFLLNLNYSSTFLKGQSRDWTADIDLETFLLEFTASKVVMGSTEISLKVPFISYNSGFLDGFLESYHNTFGFSDYGRSQRPENEFLFRISHEGKTVIEGRSGEIAPGDIRLAVKQPLLSGDPFVSLYGFVELPTGNADRGYGSGSLNEGVLLLMDKNLGESFRAYLNAGYVFTGSYRAREKIDLSDYPFAALGLEWKYSENLSVHGQWSVQGSPYNTGIRELDGIASILSFGGKYSVASRSDIELYFSEDVNTAGAPDFMIGLAYEYMFR
jgi:hypothetical protein